MEPPIRHYVIREWQLERLARVVARICTVMHVQNPSLSPDEWAVVEDDFGLLAHTLEDIQRQDVRTSCLVCQSLCTPWNPFFTFGVGTPWEMHVCQRCWEKEQDTHQTIQED